MKDSLLTRCVLFVVLAIGSAALFIGLSAAAEKYLNPLVRNADPTARIGLALLASAIVVQLVRRYAFKRDDAGWTASVVLAAVPVSLWTGALWHPWVPPPVRYEQWMLTDFPEVLWAWAGACLLVFLKTSGKPATHH